MLQERRNHILQKVTENGKVRVADLSRDLNCSEVTIRNDIKNMDQQGLLQRTHGGAVSLENKVKRKYAAESIYRNTERKREIAACAYEYIEDRDTIIIDDASSSFYLAMHIKEHPEKRLAVVTNSLLVGNELAAVRHVELYMIGGHVGGHLAATMGDAAIENMEKFNVDKGFIGVHSINFDVGLTSIATPQMQVKRAIFEASQQVFVLADSSKFGGGYVSVICPVKDVYKIITDSQISKEYIRKAEHEQIPLVIAGNREQ